MNGVYNPIIIDQNYASSHLKQVIKFRKMLEVSNITGQYTMYDNI